MLVLRGFGGLGREALQQAGGSGESEPDEQPGEGNSGDEKGCWSGDPHAEALETVHQLARQRIAKSNAELDDEAGRAVFIRKQMRDPPGGEGSEDKVDAELSLIHSDSFVNSRCLSFNEVDRVRPGMSGPESVGHLRRLAVHLNGEALEADVLLRIVAIAVHDGPLVHVQLQQVRAGYRERVLGKNGESDGAAAPDG